MAILEVWSGSDERKLQSSILQALHGFYAVGGVLSSPLARPFLGVFEQPAETNVTIGGDCKSLGWPFFSNHFHQVFGQTKIAYLSSVVCQVNL